MLSKIVNKKIYKIYLSKSAALIYLTHLQSMSSITPYLDLALLNL